MTAMSLGTGVDFSFRRHRNPAPQVKGVAPALASALRLIGQGRIGEGLNIDPGVWSGDPVPTIVLQWQQGGHDIPKATNAHFVPRPEHDRKVLRCVVTAGNNRGTARAYSEEITATYARPLALGSLSDVHYDHNLGVQVLNAFPEFTGGTLTFGITGEGVTIDPATGMVRILTDALREGVDVVVTASNSGGTVSSTFRVSIVAEASEEALAPVATAPMPISVPSLIGTGEIGAEVRLDPGAWSGDPAPELALQWQIDGAEIPGAIKASYVPLPAQDGVSLTCVVTASNASGAAQGATEALRVRYAAPQVVGSLEDLRFSQGSGGQAVVAASAFSGEVLVFSVTGAGAEIDASTGAVRLSTDVARSEEIVTVTARNSGGMAEAAFRLSVAEVPPEIAPIPEPAPDPAPQPDPVLTPAPNPAPQPTSNVSAPEASGTIANVTFAQGSGTRSISTQAYFLGEGLVYSLDRAPRGVTINEGSGLIVVSIAAALAQDPVTVRARNAVGSAVQSFAVTVGTSETVYETAGVLKDLGFVADGAAPSWTGEPDGFGRLVPAAAGRAHGAWTKAGGDGLYRCLARWNVSNPTAEGHVPFVFGAGIALNNTDFMGAFIEAYRPVKGRKLLRLRQYTGLGSETTLLDSAPPDWLWRTWYWIEMEIRGTTVKARLYPELDAAPSWQLQAVLDPTVLAASGAFGPSALPLAGVSPVLDIRRLEFQPADNQDQVIPPAAADGDWTLAQVAE